MYVYQIHVLFSCTQANQVTRERKAGVDSSIQSKPRTKNRVGYKSASVIKLIQP